ncbi:hypothetical protein C8R43DRAFT_1016145 [Mycena crocata]|nr:hypothetical protein C8R43DRAFT_1016145 [Mycena crocata]
MNAMWMAGLTAADDSRSAFVVATLHPPRLTQILHTLSMCRVRKKHCLTAVVLGLAIPGVLPMTMTGPTSGHSGDIITITWNNISSTDPTTFQIDIDHALDSLQQTDSYTVITNLETASGSATVTLPDLVPGNHRIAFSSDDGFVVLAQGSIQILPASSSGASSAPVSRPSPPPTSSLPSLSIPSSTSSSASITPTSSQASQSGGSGGQNQPKHHSNVGAIAGGVVGGIVLILLAFLAWWYLRRRNGYAAPGQQSDLDLRDEPRFLAAPVSNALAAAPPANRRSDHDEFRPWEDTETTAPTAATAASTHAPTLSASSQTFSSNRNRSVVDTATSAPAAASTNPPTRSTSSQPVSTDRKQPVVMRWQPPATATDASTQQEPIPVQDPGPSRDELLQEVARLREHIGVISPPAYPGPPT